jgi:hypothetical protein
MRGTTRIHGQAAPDGNADVRHLVHALGNEQRNARLVNRQRFDFALLSRNR